MSRSVIAKLLSNHYFSSQGYTANWRKKFMSFSWQSSHRGDMILTVKHNFDAFCLIAINSNFSPLLMYYETWELKALRKKSNTNIAKIEENHTVEEGSLQVSVQALCDHSHQSHWSIVGWHAALTFTYIIFHHFIINPRFMALVNARPLKIPLFVILSFS